MRANQGDESGQTLVEVAVACVLMAVIFGAGAGLAIQSRDAWCQIYTDTGAQQAAREGLRRLAAELATSNAARVIVTPGLDADTIRFQEPVSLAGETITWGADGTSGRWIRVRVSDGRLVREVVDGSNAVIGRPRVLVSSMDGYHAGQKGFAATVSGTLLTVTIRIRAAQSGHVWRKSFTTAVRLRN